MLVDEFRYLVPDEDYETFLKDKEPTAKMIGFFHSDLRLDGNCFDQDAEDVLNNSEYKWIKESIISRELLFSFSQLQRRFWHIYFLRPQFSTVFDRLYIV